MGVRDCVRWLADVRLDGLRCADDEAQCLLLFCRGTKKLPLNIIIHLVLIREIGHGDATTNDTLSGMRLAHLGWADRREIQAKCTNRGDETRIGVASCWTWLTTTVD